MFVTGHLLLVIVTESEPVVSVSIHVESNTRILVEGGGWEN